MHLEYLFNNDTQNISRSVSELAASNEVALRAHCQEVSRQTDTSSLSFGQVCVTKVNDVNVPLSIMRESLQELSNALAENAGVFRTQNGKADFVTVCRMVTKIEEERAHLLTQIGALSTTRFAIASHVAEANRARHLLSLATSAVSEDVRHHYTAYTECIKHAYGRLTALDGALHSAQEFYMAMIERYIPAFMQKLRAVADFNRAGEALDRGAIRALCEEFLVLFGRLPNVAF